MNIDMRSGSMEVEVEVDAKSALKDYW